jgi:hypothetical protein
MKTPKQLLEEQITATTVAITASETVLTDEFIFLEHLQDRASKSVNIPFAGIKRFGRDCKSLLRGIGRRELRLQRSLNNLKKEIIDLTVLIPISFRDHIHDLVKQLQPAKAILVREVSRHGELQQELSAHNIASWQVAGKILAKNLNIHIERSINSQNSLRSVLNSLESYLITNREDIIEKKLQETEFSWDLAAELEALGQGLTRAVIYLDANFAKEVAKLSSGKNVYHISLPMGALIITKSVRDEILKRPSSGRGALSPKGLLDYLISDLGARVEEIVPTHAEKEHAVDAWSEGWRAAKRAPSKSEHDFRIGADIKLIVAARRQRPSTPVVMLSDDNDISKPVWQMRKEGRNINTFGIKTGVLQRENY